MMEHLMPDIPRIYTAAAVWMACMLFIVEIIAAASSKRWKAELQL